MHDPAAARHDLKCPNPPSGGRGLRADCGRAGQASRRPRIRVLYMLRSPSLHPRPSNPPARGISASSRRSLPSVALPVRAGALVFRPSRQFLRARIHENGVDGDEVDAIPAESFCASQRAWPQAIFDVLEKSVMTTMRRKSAPVNSRMRDEQKRASRTFRQLPRDGAEETPPMERRPLERPEPPTNRCPHLARHSARLEQARFQTIFFSMNNREMLCCLVQIRLALRLACPGAD